MGLGEAPLGGARPGTSAPGESWIEAMESVPERCLFVVALGVYFALCVPLLVSVQNQPDLGMLFVTSAMSTALMLPLGVLEFFAPRSLLAGLLVRGIIVLLMLTAAVDFVAWLYFGEGLTASVVFILLETSARESAEFARSYASLDFLLVPLFLAAPFILRALLRRTLPGIRGVRTFAIGLFAFLTMVGVSTSFTFKTFPPNPVSELAAGLKAYQTELAAYRDIRERLTGDPPAATLTTDAEQSVHVLILGESTARRHMSLYGYPRPTTPRLDAMRKELLVFEDVVSPHSHTMAVVKKLFTFYNREAEGEWHEHEQLLPVLRGAGIQTWWISNQEAYGLWANAASALGSAADMKIFHNREPSTGAADFDEGLLPFLDQALANTESAHRFIVLHLMGTHTRYKSRYPKRINAFNEAPVDPGERTFLDEKMQTLINEYDNAVLYTDEFIAKVIERVRQVPGETSVLYLSDHGEEVYDFRDFAGHTEALGSAPMIEIPFVLWLGETYKKNHPERVQTLTSHLDAPYATDDAIHTLLDLVQTSTAELKPTRSLARPEFNAKRPRIAFGRPYERGAPDEPSKSPEKLWAHRVNTIEKLRLAEQLFAGVEVDLVFEDGRFDVNHPPAPSIGLDFETYLASLDAPNSLSYWLDLKNLSPENAAGVIERLQTLSRRFGIERERFFVESRFPEPLGTLHQAGLRTSYYLPSFDPDRASGADLDRFAEKVILGAELSAVDYISFPGEVLSVINEHISPRLPKTRLLTWYPKEFVTERESMVRLDAISKQANLDVVLVGYPSQFDR